MATQTEAPSRTTTSPLVRGVCHAFFAYDIGFAIDLDAATRALHTAAERRQLPTQRRRGAPWLGYEPLPVRVTLTTEPLTLGSHTTTLQVECTVFDFGAVSIRYAIPLDGPLESLPELSDELYDNESLLAESKRRVEELLETIRDAVTRPGVAPIVEDYMVFAIESWEGPADLESLIEACGPLLARVLRAETGELSTGQVVESLAGRVSFGTADAVFASWESAIVLDRDSEDVLTVLEHVNIELAEMRVLDRSLDRVLDDAHHLIQRQASQRFWPHGPGQTGLRTLATAQMDAALMFESVNNAIKLVGDQHLSRVYKLAASRVHMTEWDTGILRKLEIAESIYQKLTHFEASRRMELLEIVIVLLILISIILPFLPFYSH